MWSRGWAGLVMWPAAGCRAVPALSWSPASDWSDPAIPASDWLWGGVRAQLITGQSPGPVLSSVAPELVTVKSPQYRFEQGSGQPCLALPPVPGQGRGDGHRVAVGRRAANRTQSSWEKLKSPGYLSPIFCYTRSLGWDLASQVLSVA